MREHTLKCYDKKKKTASSWDGALAISPRRHPSLPSQAFGDGKTFAAKEPPQILSHGRSFLSQEAAAFHSRRCRRGFHQAAVRGASADAETSRPLEIWVSPQLAPSCFTRWARTLVSIRGSGKAARKRDIWRDVWTPLCCDRLSGEGGGSSPLSRSGVGGDGADAGIRSSASTTPGLWAAGRH